MGRINKKIPFQQKPVVDKFLDAYNNNYPVKDGRGFYWVVDVNYIKRTDELKFKLDYFSFY